ncbi:MULTISPECIES: hypothetical protein [Streptomyces]|uniref:Uncharacterized protein n=1 Tax=Streptomyces liliifuscus TaxID=2797636 RepID=A0A7T7KZH1_9ACTN|nr:hypothetical protein [Streptomyces liliifuscus]QQM43672.1 hypothetical protein JEQ17_32675 [Streptomyces liliifuscus]
MPARPGPGLRREQLGGPPREAAGQQTLAAVLAETTTEQDELYLKVGRRFTSISR